MCLRVLQGDVILVAVVATAAHEDVQNALSCYVQPLQIHTSRTTQIPSVVMGLGSASSRIRRPPQAGNRCLPHCSGSSASQSGRAPWVALWIRAPLQETRGRALIGTTAVFASVSRMSILLHSSIWHCWVHLLLIPHITLQERPLAQLLEWIFPLCGVFRT